MYEGIKGKMELNLKNLQLLLTIGCSDSVGGQGGLSPQVF